MAYIGFQPNTPLLNTSTQFFSGNAVATQFTLNRSVATASDVDVMVGNQLQIPFANYTAGNISLQFTSPPASGSNNISVTYRAGALSSLDLTASVFNAGTAAAPSVVSLAANNTGLYWANASSLVVTASGSDRVTFNANTTSTSTTSGALVVYGGAGIAGNIFIQGQANITNPVDSSSVSTGSLVTAGGAGIAGNLNVGGDITCVGDFTVNGTFTTTGVDSLAVTDPFIFLANANPGDTFDTGIVSQFFDGVNTRFTGYFRDITDAKYKLFTNLLTAPTTTVDTTDPSFEFTDLILANLSAIGNVSGTYFVGNGSALTGISASSNNIFNANSSVSIAAVNANVNIVINGTQIANVSSGGISVVGAVSASTTLSATGNVTGGNIITVGLTSATGNITSAGNVAGGNVLTGGAVSAAGNITGGNVIGTTAVSTGGNVQAGNVKTTGLVSATGDVLCANVSAGNVSTTGAVSVTGNIDTGGVITAVGNITGNYFLGNGSQLTGIDATSIQSGNSNVRVVSSGGNVTVGVGGTANIAVFSTLGANVAGWIGATGNLGVAGNVAFTGTVQNINIGTSQTTGNVTVGGTAQTGTILIGQSTNPQTINIGHGATGTGNTKTIQIGENGLAGSTTLINIGPATATTAAGTVTFNTATVVAIANTSGTALSVAGNVTGANVRTGGAISATGTVTGGNLATGGTASATGNITGGNIITAGAISAASVSASGTVIGVGNITGANILTGGLISATGNVTGGNINTAGLISVTGNVQAVGNVSGGNILTANVVQGLTLSATGNVIGGNLNAAGLSLSGNVVSGIATTANITGGNINGTLNGSGANVSSISATNISAGTLTQARLANAAVTLGSTALTLGATVTTVAGLVSVSATTFTGALTGAATTAATVTTAAQPNITSVGTLSGLTINNATTAITNGGTNGVGNIGASGAGFNTVFAKSTSAQYADLAEYYAADAAYVPGTVLVFGGDQEVTMGIVINDVRVAGVVSTNPAYAMNTAIQAEHTVALALSGRVPTLVVGAVAKGDMMVTAGGGRAQACAQPVMGSVIGKAVQDHPGGVGTIEIVVGRM